MLRVLKHLQDVQKVWEVQQVRNVQYVWKVQKVLEICKHLYVQEVKQIQGIYGIQDICKIWVVKTCLRGPGGLEGQGGSSGPECPIRLRGKDDQEGPGHSVYR